MDTKQKKLDEIGKKNPFIAPEGYFEQLTSNIMEQLPESEPEKELKITWMDRVRPWLYMAAVFAGLGLFFKFLVGPVDSRSAEESAMGEQIVQIDDSEVYWDILETTYADNILLEEIAGIE